MLGLLDFSLASSSSPLLSSPPPRLPPSEPPAQEIVRPPLHYAPAQVSGPVCVAASCTRNNKALKKIFSAPSAQKVKNFLCASREKEISFLEGGESLEVLVTFFMTARSHRRRKIHVFVMARSCNHRKIHCLTSCR